MDEHYLKVQHANIKIQFLDKIGWFQKQIDMAMTDLVKYVKFFDIEKKEKS